MRSVTEWLSGVAEWLSDRVRSVTEWLSTGGVFLVVELDIVVVNIIILSFDFVGFSYCCLSHHIQL